MRPILLTVYSLLFHGILFGQAYMDFDSPMIDMTAAFLTGQYDTALIRKNKVESCQEQNQTFYFDSSGRLVKSVLITLDGTTQLQWFHYNTNGDLVSTEVTSPKYPKPILLSSYKIYDNGVLVKDSSSPGYLCKHFEYYPDGNLRQVLWFGLNHRLERTSWFGLDNEGRRSSIIERDYMNNSDSVGQLLSNRTLSYNEKGQMIKEEETVTSNMNHTKNLFCGNVGSGTFSYDSFGRLVETVRPKGPSQKIKYLDNGLIAEIESRGKNCEDVPYHGKLKYIYTYRK